jgi:hypothetical protein
MLRPLDRAGLGNQSLGYFSAADGGIDDLLTQDDFERSVRCNLLFEPHGLIIPDVFLFNNRHLLQDLLTSDRSIMKSALRNKLAVVAVRKADDERLTFREILKNVTEGNIMGVDPEMYAMLSSRPDRVASDLDAYVTSGVFEVWPEGMGVSFQHTLEEQLFRDDVAFRDERIQHLWLSKRQWVKAIIEDARNRSLRSNRDPDSDPGIRRGEVWNSLGAKLGLRDTYQKPHHLMRDIRGNITDWDTRQIAAMVYRVVNLLYQRSQAARFDSLHNVPRPLMEEGLAFYATDARPAAALTFRHVVQLPTLSRLQRLSPEQILRLRQEHGESYFEARAAWLAGGQTPEEESRSLIRLEKAVEAYASEIRKAAADPQVRQVAFSIGAASHVTIPVLEYVVEKDAAYPEWALATHLATAIVMFVAWLPPFPRDTWEISLERNLMTD